MSDELRMMAVVFAGEGRFEMEQRCLRLAGEFDRLNAMIRREAADWADTDTHIRRAAKRVLPAAFVDGDSVSVTPVEDIVDELVERVAALESFAAELWCIDRDNAKSTAESGDEEMTAWARGLLEEAARLGIDDLAAALEAT